MLRVSIFLFYILVLFFASCSKIENWLKPSSKGGAYSLDSIVTVYGNGITGDAYYKKRKQVFYYNRNNRCERIETSSWLVNSPYFIKDTTYYFLESDTVFIKIGLLGSRSFYLRWNTSGYPIGYNSPKNIITNSKNILSKIYTDTSYVLEYTNYASDNRKVYRKYISYASRYTPTGTYPITKNVDSISVLENSTTTLKGFDNMSVIVNYNMYYLQKLNDLSDFTNKTFIAFLTKPDGTVFAGKCYERFQSSLVYSEYLLPQVEFLYNTPKEYVPINTTVIHSFSTDNLNWINYSDRIVYENSVITSTDDRISRIDQFGNGKLLTTTFYYYH